jgi:hypothetical protein
MCSFLITNKKVDQETLDNANYFLKFRGPDFTNQIKENNFTFIHNLLSINGKFTPQPFIEDNIVCVFNGEIYNYKEFDPNATSDGQVLIKLYKEFGNQFFKKLDGEFAIVIVDFNKNIILAAVDTFECKPLFLSRDGGSFGASSLRSGLIKLGYKQIKEIRANTIIQLNLKTLKTELLDTITHFDVHSEHKDNFDDWHDAFEASVNKRMTNLNTDYSVIADLSEGYDTGSIVACLKRFNHKNVVIRSIYTQDKYPHVLKWRHNILDAPLPKNSKNNYFEPGNLNFKKNLIVMEESKFNLSALIYKKRVEDYTYVLFDYNGRMIRRKTSDHFSKYCYIYDEKLRLENNTKVALCGTGGDGVANPYANLIYKKYNHIWPCMTFRENVPYLNEVIGGSHGIEFRYPYYDKKLWQETFYLNKKICINENKNHKPPLHAYLEKNNFPFYERNEDGKINFYWVGFGNFMYDNIKKSRIDWGQPHFWNER